MPTITKCSGLITDNSELEKPEGSLEVADNVVIDRDDVIEPRNGFNYFGNTFGSTTDRLKQIMVYKSRILRNYGSTIQYDSNGDGAFQSFSGSYNEVESGVRLKYQEAKSNLYFTSSNGIKKISALSASDFTTATDFVERAGAPKAVDIFGILVISSGGFLPPQSKCAYRIVWGKRDANNNLLLGYPSERFVLSNTAAIASDLFATSTLTFTVPSDVINTTYFYQIYRTGTIQTTGIQTLNDIDPGDDLNLVYEAQVTQDDINNGEVQLDDIIPDDFREVGSYLYTNPNTGEGILQANERPPVATDLALFRNTMFYANTRTAHKKQLTLLSADDFVSGSSKLYIGNSDIARSYTFVGNAEITSLTCNDKTNTNETNANNSYILLNAAENERKYYVWFDKGTGVDPEVTGRIGVKIDLAAISTPSDIASAISNALNDTDDFNCTTLTNVVTITNIKNGDCDNASTPTNIATDVGTGWALSTTTQGDGEGRRGAISSISLTDPAIITTSSNHGLSTGEKVHLKANSLSAIDDEYTITVITPTTFSVLYDNTAGSTSTGRWYQNDILISGLLSVGQAIDDTARSMVSVINKDLESPVNAFYISGADDLPGLVLLENRVQDDTPFYVGCNSSAVSTEFSPTLPISVNISKILFSSGSGSNAKILSTAHGLSTGNEVFIFNASNGVGGNYVITVIDSNNFTIPKTITVEEDPSLAIYYKSTVYSDDEKSQNRVYFSKTDLPEAVPILNYLDIGPKDKKIQRILALRDNLYVLKEDGIYIITGTTSPNFGSRLVDSSTQVFAPDTAAILNNQIYCLSSQGIVGVTESINIVSGPIENKILEITNSKYNYKNVSFGFSSEPDRAYHLFLPTFTSDTTATQCYRYNIFTRCWSRWDIAATCGQVNEDIDKIYLGDAKSNNIFQERKNLDRTDKCDYDFNINLLQYSGSDMLVNSVSDVQIGDALVQEQYISISFFNRLLKKLDMDNGLDDADYFSTLEMSQGDNLKTSLDALNVKLVADDSSGIITSRTFSLDFTTAKDEFNLMIAEMNNSASDCFYKNYKQASILLVYESLITSIDTISNSITPTDNMPFLEGDVTVYKKISTTVQWSLMHFGDPSTHKQISENTVILDQNNITNATLEFSTDLSQNFEGIEVAGRGSGIFGNPSWGDFVWGGLGTEAPIRTFIPTNKQRCRYIRTRFKHSNARENYNILGISFKVRPYSTRAYR